MYKIAYLHKNEQQEKDLYIPGDRDYCLTDGQLHVGMGISGELDIYIPNNNPARSDIECLTDEIIVYRDDAEIWRGRPITLQIDFDMTGKLTCEGILSYLYDTYYPPFEFEGSPNDLLKDVIANHNSQVEERKQFTLGEITVEDSNDYINRSSIYYNRTLSILEEKFVKDSLGGYFRVRVENGTRYLDYLTAYDTESSQPVRYGYNLLDIAQNVEYNDVATVILPLGARLTDEDGMETDERLTIESVNNGSIYIVDQAAVDEYGWIVQEMEWDDVTVPQNLYDKGFEALTQLTSPISQFDIQMVDLSQIDPEVDPINLGDFVLIRVDAFGMNQMAELTTMDIDLTDPTNTILHFGTDAATLTGSTNNTARSIQESMGALSMRVTNLSADVINAVYANIENIIAGTITTDYIRAAVADLGYVTADWVQANFADISYLEANYATILDLNVAFENVELLDADVANIKNVLAGNVGTGDLQTIVLTSENAFIEEAVIVNALMDTVLASVLTAGVIYTDYIKIADNEGQYLWIDGSTLQFKDENGTVRVQIGMDGDGNYNYYLWDKNGVLIWNPLGLTEEGLTGNGAIIKDEAVANDANISGYKLNIQEVAQILNEEGDLILNATQVIIDGETLDYQLTQITKQIEGLESEGLIKIETYYSLGTSEAPYHAPGDDSANALLGKMVLGQAVLGESGSGWTLIQPTPDDGQYVWFSIKGTYLDGSEQWTDPTLLTDAATRSAVNMLQTEFQVVQGSIEGKIWMEDIYTVVDGITDELTDVINEQYGQFTVLIDTIDARVGSLTTTVNDYYEELKSSITAITLDEDGILEEVRKVYEWTSDGLTELSEQYAEISVTVNAINSDIVNVWAELAENYSTTTQVTNLIDQAVTQSESDILIAVSYDYVSQSDLKATLGDYYTAADTDALILAQASETSATILESVSATYATQSYVNDVLKDLDLEGVTNIETYYCVSDNGTDSPNYTIYTSDDSFDGWNEYFYNGTGTAEIVSGSLGTYIRVYTTSDSGYTAMRYAIGTGFAPGNYTVKFKAATEAGYEETARYRVGLGGSTYWNITGARGVLKSDQWTEFELDYDLNETYTDGTMRVYVDAYDQDIPILYKDIEVIYEGSGWSTDYPTVETGEYLWVRYLITYNDGTTAWTEPFCATTNLEDYPTVTTMTAAIEQYVDESMASISLVVSSTSVETMLSTGTPTSLSGWSTSSVSGATGSLSLVTDDALGQCFRLIRTDTSTSTDAAYGMMYKIGDTTESGTYHISFKASTESAYDVSTVVLGFQIGNSDDRLDVRFQYLYADGWSTFNLDYTVSASSEYSSNYFRIYVVTSNIPILLSDITVTYGNDTAAGDLGAFAGIYLMAGDNVLGEGTLDLRKVRQAFANDSSSITIAAGTVSFLSNTLIIASKCLELDASGNLTISTNQFTLTSTGNASFSGTLKAPDGEIGGWMIEDNALYNGTLSMTSTINGTYIGTDGIRQYSSGNYMNIDSTVITNGTSSNDYVSLAAGTLQFYHSGTYLGYYGTEYYNQETSKFGLAVHAKYNNQYIAFGRETSSSTTTATWDYLINYGLSSSYLGYSEKHIFYGSARFTGSVSGLSAATVTVEGNVYNTGEYYTASDEKVKVDINDMLNKVDPDDLIDRLEPVTYELTADESGKTHFGLTYQNLKEAIEAEGMDSDEMGILSETNDRDGNTIGTIAYDELIPVLIGEIQSLKKEVNTLKAGNA